MPYKPNLNFKLSDGRDLGSLGWITKEYLMTVYPHIAGQMITPELWVWGSNGFTELGIGPGTPNTVCTPVTTFAGGSNWKNIASTSGRSRHIAAIKDDGTLWLWGNNAESSSRAFITYQLGTNAAADASTPVTTFAGGTNWKQVSCGHMTTGAVKTDGTLWMWGYNPTNALGSLDTFDRATPITTFAGGTNWKQVACGKHHTAAIKTDGSLWIWGWNTRAELGTNDAVTRPTPVTTFAGGNDWKQVSCSEQHTAAIKTDGTLWLWGDYGDGKLGNNISSANNSISTPVTTFAGGNDWKQVSASFYNTVAIKNDGTLWIWGNGSNGVLGVNSTANRLTPVTTFAGGTNWKQVSIGDRSTAAIKTDGSLWVWGLSGLSSLGINDTIDRHTPVTTFAGGTNWKQVRCSMYSMFAIKTSDDLQGI